MSPPTPTDTSGVTAAPSASAAATRIDATGMVVIPLDECLFLLRSAAVGRLAFVDSLGVTVLPVNHHVDGFDIYFRSAPGSKVEAARKASSAAFEVDGIDDLQRGGWSVVATGQVHEATPMEVTHLSGAPLLPWADGVPRDHWLVLRVHRVTGRMIHRPTVALPTIAPAHTHTATFESEGDGGSTHLRCTCGWRSRPVSATDHLDWARAREEYHEHVMTTGAEAHGRATPTAEGATS